MRRSRVVCVLAGAILSTGAAAQDGLSSADRALARDIFKQLIEINTTDSLGNTPRAARAMAQRLLAAGFPARDVRVLIGPMRRTATWWRATTVREREAARSSSSPT